MTRRTELLLWLIATIGLGSAVGAARAARPEPLPPRARDGTRLEVPLLPAESLGARVLRTVTTDPFRFARHQSGIPFGVPARGSSLTVVNASVPALAIRGVLGPPWVAVLEGAPYSEVGLLVRVGDTIAGARVHLIRPSSVTLRNSDTTWTLTLRSP
jgi:hypothetical protein